MLPRPSRHAYFESWLNRTRRRLSASGQLSEMAVHLANAEGNSPEHWAQYLRELLEERVVPSLDLLTLIDGILAKPAREQGISPDQPSLF